MNKVITLQHPAITFGIPFLLLTALVTCSLNPFLVTDTPNANFYNGLILDFILTVPFVYFLLIYKKQIPKITILSCSIIGLVIAKQCIPSDQQSLLDLIMKYVLPVLELAVVFYVGYKMYLVRKETKKLKLREVDFFSSLREACKEVFPGIVGVLLATEIAVIYYSLFCWKKKPLHLHDYSYYKKSGIYMVISMLLFLVVVETVVMHALLHDSKPGLALFLSFLSAYSILQIVALMRSFTKLPIKLDPRNRKLELCYGFFSDCIIDIDEIENITATGRVIDNIEGAVKLSPLDMIDTHNLIIHLKSQHILNGFYGRKKPFRAIAIFIDERENFLSDINSMISIEKKEEI
jgi:hypothetical protein